MSERKSINKYYPPDYDPIAAEKEARKLAKKNKTKDKNVVTIRLMTPFSMKCTKCSNYIAKSKKFNGKKELLPERYLESIKIYRLTIRCPFCANSISFKTDPKNADYAMEVGAERTFVPSNIAKPDEDIDETIDRLLKEKEVEEDTKTQRRLNNADKLDELEEQLSNLQRQQEEDEELAGLRKMNQKRLRKIQELNDTDKLTLNDTRTDLELERKWETRRKEQKLPLGPQKTNDDLKELLTIRNLQKKPANPLGIKIKKKSGVVKKG